MCLIAAPLPPIGRPGPAKPHMKTWEILVPPGTPRLPLSPDDPHRRRRLYRLCKLKLLSASRSPWKQKFRKTPRGGPGSARFRLACLQVEANQRPDRGLPFLSSWPICLHPLPASNSKRHHTVGAGWGPHERTSQTWFPLPPLLLRVV